MSDPRSAALDERLARLGVREADLEERFHRSGGAGGQNVNKVETGVTLVHRPSGVSVRCEESRSQGENRRLARLRLAVKLEELARAKVARERHEREKARRQKRGLSAGAKRRRRENKRRRSDVKSGRGRVRHDE
ncbi:MAG TPA: peptide chain release factor-like protein [Elusimicrobiota bacterium]|nr:peptide chain release factor-like protein [Elusimicrobiota bacterium]